MKSKLSFFIVDLCVWMEVLLKVELVDCWNGIVEIQAHCLRGALMNPGKLTNKNDLTQFTT